MQNKYFLSIVLLTYLTLTSCGIKKPVEAPSTTNNHQKQETKKIAE